MYSGKDSKDNNSLYCTVSKILIKWDTLTPESALPLIVNILQEFMRQLISTHLTRDTQPMPLISLIKMGPFLYIQEASSPMI